MSRPRFRWLAMAALLAALAGACGSASEEGGGAGDDRLTVYSGRAENLIGPLLEQFGKDTGVDVDVRYAGSSELAAQLAEEGDRSPADVFLSQDAGALGSLARRSLLQVAPAEALSLIDARFRARDNTWVGVSGRARVIAFDPRQVPEDEVPDSVFALTDPRWKGRIGFAPTNASFQSFVTAMRVQVGEDRTRQWLLALKANDPEAYEGNAPIVRAINDGQVALGLVNHYYLHELVKELGRDKVVVRNHFPTDGDPGALVNVAGVGILKSAEHPGAAARFVNYLLTPTAQRFFAEQTSEYPLVAGVAPPPDAPPLATIQSPAIDLADLATLDQTLALLREVGLL
ncbi:MAG TPA: iron ABC transporter substrate-binding protein [Acidimicrobiales bacterium]|nr:iron ABC transporter substrate-binding protein [Acidimicrobiales bacterium]